MSHGRIFNLSNDFLNSKVEALLTGSRLSLRLSFALSSTKWRSEPIACLKSSRKKKAAKLNLSSSDSESSFMKLDI